LLNIAIYILATLVANYTATWFFPLPVFGLVSVGTLVFGVTFTQRDRVHRLGRRTVYAMILAAAVLNSLQSVFLDVSWRIILASFTAIVLAETADTEVYQRLMGRSWTQRVAGSNAVSIPLDSVIFNAIAFAGVFPLAKLAAIVFGEIVFKTIVGALTALWKSSTGARPVPRSRCRAV
jgi:uncharacterized PurR-regulated membrane protein YhhQ (DUF165 family)